MDISALMTISGDPSVDGSVVATAIHAGHALRPEVAADMRLDESVRLREEDPFTDRIAAAIPVNLVVHRSRFEVDMNRARAESVYRGPDDAWGLDVWKRPLGSESVSCSRAEYDEFYAAASKLLDSVARRGAFVVLDVHSYNHRRDGSVASPAPAEENPDVNVGTGTLDATRCRTLVDHFMEELRGVFVAGRRLDVRENVRFRGGHFSKWVNERYRGTGSALAIEFKKTFMDEWTGAVDSAHLEDLAAALRDTMPTLQHSLGNCT